MTVSETEQSVNTFFESYRLAFERLDASAIAEHFAYPSHITSDAREIGLISIASQQGWIGEIERLLGMYRAIGFGSARILNLIPTALSPRLAQVRVHWALSDGAGQHLYDFQALYTLAEIDKAFRITAIAHNEIPRYREYLARRQSMQVQGENSFDAHGSASQQPTKANDQRANGRVSP